MNPCTRLVLLIACETQFDQRIRRIEDRTQLLACIRGCYYTSTRVVVASVHRTLWRALGLDRGDFAKPEQTNARRFLAESGENSKNILFDVRGVDVHCLRQHKRQQMMNETKSKLHIQVYNIGLQKLPTQSLHLTSQHVMGGFVVEAGLRVVIAVVTGFCVDFTVLMAGPEHSGTITALAS